MDRRGRGAPGHAPVILLIWRVAALALGCLVSLAWAGGESYPHLRVPLLPLRRASCSPPPSTSPTGASLTARGVRDAEPRILDALAGASMASVEGPSIRAVMPSIGGSAGLTVGRDRMHGADDAADLHAFFRCGGIQHGRSRGVRGAGPRLPICEENHARRLIDTDKNGEITSEEAAKFIFKEIRGSYKTDAAVNDALVRGCPPPRRRPSARELLSCSLWLVRPQPCAPDDRVAGSRSRHLLCAPQRRIRWSTAWIPRTLAATSQRYASRAHRAAPPSKSRRAASRSRTWPAGGDQGLPGGPDGQPRHGGAVDCVRRRVPEVLPGLPRQQHLVLGLSPPRPQRRPIPQAGGPRRSRFLPSFACRCGGVRQMAANVAWAGRDKLPFLGWVAGTSWASNRSCTAPRSSGC